MVFLAVLVIFGLEFFMKRHMDAVRTLEEQHTLADGKIILKKYHNTGAAGNFLSHAPRAIQCIHAAMLGGVFTELIRLFPRKGAGAAKLGLVLMAGGGLSNLYDRLAKGYVVDYISFGFGPKRFRKLVFNMADFCVFAGALIVSAVVCGTKHLKE